MHVHTCVLYSCLQFTDWYYYQMLLTLNIGMALNNSLKNSNVKVWDSVGIKKIKNQKEGQNEISSKIFLSHKAHWADCSL